VPVRHAGRELHLRRHQRRDRRGLLRPRKGGTDELDGYYLAYGTDLDNGVSSLYIWDASALPTEPVATVTLPRRVPNGLHGNWFPAT
jgi:carotenoid cleavage dioxygenase